MLHAAPILNGIFAVFEEVQVYDIASKLSLASDGHVCPCMSTTDQSTMAFAERLKQKPTLEIQQCQSVEIDIMKDVEEK